MKILIVGGNGTIGRPVTSYFEKEHKTIVAGRSKGDVQVDLRDCSSIQSMFNEVGELDAILSIAGEAKWAPIDYLKEDDFYIGIKSKLMGQVNLTRIGKDFLSIGGSITLTTGILADDPIVTTTSAALVNGAIHSFVKAMSLELNFGKRINAVSPGLVETATDGINEKFPGYNPVPIVRVVNAYVRSVMGKLNGEIIREY